VDERAAAAPRARRDRPAVWAVAPGGAFIAEYARISPLPWLWLLFAIAPTSVANAIGRLAACEEDIEACTI